MLLQLVEIENTLGGLNFWWLYDHLKVVILFKGIILLLYFFLGLPLSKRLENILVLRLSVLLVDLLDAFHKDLLLLLFLQAQDLPLPHEQLLSKPSNTIFARFNSALFSMRFNLAAAMCWSNLIFPSSLSYSIKLKLDMLCWISI